MSDLQILWNYVLSWMTQIFNLYTSYLILSFSFALWLINFAVNFIRRVQGKR